MFKKIRIFITLALILTIGGVYAQFNYAQQNAAESNANLNANLAAAVTSGQKGTINIENTMTLKIDDTNSDLITELHPSGEFKVSFTPSHGADSAVTQNGIKLKMKITIDGINTYNDQTIYVLKNLDSNSEVVLNENKPVKDQILVNLLNYIGVNGISLPTYTDYQAFSAVHQGITIKITISEALDTTTGGEPAQS